MPDLHNVVFRHRADDPGLVGVPGEVRDLGCVASMDKLVDRRKATIFIIMIADDVTNKRRISTSKVQEASMRLTSSSGGPSSASSGDCSSPILLQKRERRVHHGTKECYSMTPAHSVDTGGKMLSCLPEVPDVEAAVCSAGCQYGLIMR